MRHVSCSISEASLRRLRELKLESQFSNVQEVVDGQTGEKRFFVDISSELFNRMAGTLYDFFARGFNIDEGISKL